MIVLSESDSDSESDSESSFENSMGAKKQIFSQMFDVRPVDKSGDLDMEKIQGIRKVVWLKNAEENKKQEAEEIIYFNQPPQSFNEKNKISFQNYQSEDEDESEEYNLIFKKNFPDKIEDFKEAITDKIGQWKKYFWFFPKAMLAISAAAFIFYLAGWGIEMKNGGIQKGQKALADIMEAKKNLAGFNLEKSQKNFSDAYKSLNEISGEFNGVKGVLAGATKYIPYLSKISSGSHLAEAGKDVSEAGILIAGMLQDIDKIKSGNNQAEPLSYLEIFQGNKEKMKRLAELSKNIQNNLDNVNSDDIPEGERVKFSQIKSKLPQINASLEEFLRQEDIFTDILGGNGPRKYLFLFQNNQEMRATGGFIGSYAILDIFNGRVRKFMIDGIFNPDGQLRERVIPPKPIQKISADWSLHDSNWFPDFPVSAEKAAWFYEKTGGPTVDGIITMTPTVMQKLLEITGPIEMPEYGTTVDKDNFVEKIQYEVEVDYDKELNQPKKILADLAPKILDRIFNSADFSEMSKTMNILLESLNEKHILLYSKNWEIEKAISENGWSGEVLNTQKDYLSVINSNINGFKTDGVIEEEISHKAEIQNDGSVIDTLTITRKHNGGDSAYDWWNKVNADYIRVYVPQGSKLLSASGQTRELNISPLDYGALGYKTDPQVKMEEDSAQVDDESGTIIYDDAGKTVFANWAYVSPKETVTIQYVYLLPFKIDINLPKKPSDSYSLLAQKQAGSLGDKFSSEISYPDLYKTIWQYPEDEISAVQDLPDGQKGIKMETDLKTDKFIGAVLMKE